MGVAVPMLTQAEALSSLKRFHDDWLVAIVNGTHYWCDGSAIIVCDEKPQFPLHFNDWMARRWKGGIHDAVASVSDLSGRRPVPLSETILCGWFGNGYRRRIIDLILVHVNERYVRALPASASTAWLKGPTDPVVFTDGMGALCGIVMPLRDRAGTGVALSDLPEIPFLEDGVLYHVCEEED